MGNEPLSVHRFSFTGLVSRYAPYAMLLGVFAAIAAGLLALAASRPDSGTLVPGLLFAVAAVACVAPLVYAFARRTTRVEVYPDGLHWQGGVGAGRCSWEDVKSVYRMEKITNNFWRQTELKLVLASGDTVSFNHTLTDYNKLADAVQTNSARVLLEPMRRAFASGEAEFGPVVLESYGIRMSGELLPWSEVRQHTVYNGALLVNTDRYQGWEGKAVALSEVPNYLVLLHLIDERRRSGEDGGF